MSASRSYPPLDSVSDASEAEYVEGLSELREYRSGLRANEAAQATVRRFLQQYFAELYAQQRLAVGTVLARDQYQNFAFKIICEQEVKIENFLTTPSAASDSSIIVIAGLQSERPTPTFPWSPGWLPSTISRGVGTVWISKEEFLQRLLDILETFNAQTTIVRGSDDKFITLYARHGQDESGMNGYAGVPMEEGYGGSPPATKRVEDKGVSDTLVTVGGMLLPLLTQFGHVH